MSIRRVIIVEPYLRNEIGHYYNYISAVQSEMIKHGIKVLVLGSNEANDNCRRIRQLYPIFENRKMDRTSRFTKAKSLFSQALQFSRELHDVFIYRPVVPIEDGDVLFMDTVLDFQSIGWGLFWRSARDYLAMHSIKGVFLLRHRLLKPSSAYSAISKFIAVLAYRYLLIRNHTILATDSDLLKQEIQSLLGIPLHVFPIPLALSYMAEDIKPGNDNITVTFLGGFNYGKGFDLFVKTINQIPLRLRDRIMFKVQADLSASYAPRQPQEVTWAIENLRSLVYQMPNLKLLAYPLSQQAYFEAIKESDIVVLPYRGFHFAKATSNMFGEVVSLGRIPVVSRDTWMADQCSRLGLGALIFEVEDPTSMVEVIRYAVEQRVHLLDKMRSIQKKWCEFHNPSRFVEQFIHLVNSNGENS